jgi:hypothetical protein
MAPRARFELATLRLTAERIKNLSALSGVAYEKLGAIFPFLVAPNPAPTVMTSKSVGTRSQSGKFFEGLIDRHFPQRGWPGYSVGTELVLVCRPSARNTEILIPDSVNKWNSLLATTD